MSRPSSVLLEFNPEFTQSPRKRTVKRLNLKRENAGHFSVRDTPFRHLNNTSVFSARNTPYMLTSDSTKAMTQTDIILEKPSYRSSSSRAASVQKKTRPTLVHTEGLQKSISEKLTKVQEKYGVEYKNMLKAHGINVEKEDPQEVMRKSQEVFNGTYSVKYFGVMDSNIGVVSQRLPLQYAPKSREQFRINSPNSSRPLKFYYHEAPPGKLDAIKKETELIGPTTLAAWNKADRLQSLITEEDSYDEIVTQALSRQRNRTPKEKHIRQQEGNIKDNEKSEQVMSQSGKIQPEESLFKLVPLRSKSPIEARNGPDEQLTVCFDINLTSERQKAAMSERNFLMNSGRRTVLSTERPVNTPVSPFFRNIKSVRRLRPNRKEPNSAVSNSNQSSQKQLVNEDRSKELWHLRESQQLRESQLLKTRRNVVNTEPNRNKEYVDEFSVPEKFRSHEVKAITANKATYSYSKLLNNLYSREKPEIELLENTQKLFEINVKRGELRQAHVQSQNEKHKKRSGERKRSNSPKEYREKEEDNNIISGKGPFCIKITEQTMSPMYATFMKIKGKAKNSPTNK